jgi:hypothetical protein
VVELLKVPKADTFFMTGWSDFLQSYINNLVTSGVTADVFPLSPNSECLRGSTFPNLVPT